MQVKGPSFSLSHTHKLPAANVLNFYKVCCAVCNVPMYVKRTLHLLARGRSKFALPPWQHMVLGVVARGACVGCQSGSRQTIGLQYRMVDVIIIVR